MANVDFSIISWCQPLVVASAGSAAELAACDESCWPSQFDLLEIRMDILARDGAPIQKSTWDHLRALPLLFTARCQSEGGATMATAGERTAWLLEALDDAALIDIELASVKHMKNLIDSVRSRGLPWIASSHFFEKLPELGILTDAVAHAKEAGAHAFKIAAMLHSVDDIVKLTDFQKANHGIPVATMGMGKLAPASRLLCAQYGSVLNYGFLGERATAPGQWPAALLKNGIDLLEPISI